MKNLLAIIPARSGSKRLPGKNTKIFNNKPLVEWSIITAINSQMCSTIVVTTDDSQIIKLCKKYPDVKIINRKTELCLDTTKSEAVILDVMEQIEQHNKIILLQPTSPLRSVFDIMWSLYKSDTCTVSTDESGKWNGSIYICAWEKFIKDGTFKPDNYYVIPDERSIDIDCQADFDKAEKYIVGEIQ